MSRSCAKPTCSDLAVSWFELSRETQQVTRSSVPAAHGIALCQTHADRFGVPGGWTLVTVDDPSEITTSPEAPIVEAEVVSALVESDRAERIEPGSAENEAAENGSVEVHRIHDRDNPWFVPVSPSNDSSASESSVGTEVSAEIETLAHPTSGSLLHRAFHGPEPSASDRAPKSAVPEPAVDELSPRRRARSSSDEPEEEAEGLYHTLELPFPPHVRHVAVS